MGAPAIYSSAFAGGLLSKGVASTHTRDKPAQAAGRGSRRARKNSMAIGITEITMIARMT
jgi:hypothetical protein